MNILNVDVIDGILKKLLDKLKNNPNLQEQVLEQFLCFEDSYANQSIVFYMFKNVYVLWKCMSENEEVKVLDELETLPYSKIIELYYKNDKFRRTIIRNFIRILNSPNLEELVDYNKHYLGSLKSFKEKSYFVYTIGDIISMFLEDLYQEYIDEGLERILECLKNDNDCFNTYLKVFRNKKEYLAIKPMIIAKLYADAYLFLLIEKENGFISNDLDKLLEEIKKRLEGNDIYNLPSNKDDALFLLQSFYYFNTNRSKLQNQNSQSLKTLQDTLKRSKSIFLVDYC